MNYSVVHVMIRLDIFCAFNRITETKGGYIHDTYAYNVLGVGNYTVLFSNCNGGS